MPGPDSLEWDVEISREGGEIGPEVEYGAKSGDLSQDNPSLSLSGQVAPNAKSKQLRRVQNPDKAAAARLSAARRDAGYRSASEFARAARVNPVTYMHHESGYRAITRHAAALYAHLLGTTAQLLLFGREKEQPAREIRVVGFIRSSGAVDPIDARRQRNVALIPEDDLVCHQVLDDELFPAFRKGDLVLHRPLNHLTLDLPAINGLECVVQLASGEFLLRQVLVDAHGRAALISYRGPPMLNAQLAAAEPVLSVQRG